jgi:2-isopropylmalate synthase
MWDQFRSEYLPEEPAFRLRAHELNTSSADDTGRTVIQAQVDVKGQATSIRGEGDGPVEAFVSALLSEFGDRVGNEFDVLDYAEHAIGQGADTMAVAYLETVRANGDIRWGVGQSPNITTASLRAVLAAFERHTR